MAGRRLEDVLTAIQIRVTWAKLADQVDRRDLNTPPLPGTMESSPPAP
jgi:hypothetical protein